MDLPSMELSTGRGATIAADHAFGSIRLLAFTRYRRFRPGQARP